MVYNRRRFQQQYRWQKKSNACETTDTDSTVAVAMPLQAHSCSNLEALMKGAVKREECKAHVQGEDVEHVDYRPLALVEHCNAMAPWGEIDESSKLSWADVSEPSEQTEDSVCFTCAEFIDEQCTFVVGDVPVDCSCELSFSQQETGFRTPSTIAAGDDIGNFEMCMDYTTSGDAMCTVIVPPMTLPLYWEGVCDYTAAHSNHYDYPPSVHLCSDAANASVNTLAENNSSVRSFHDRVCEALAAAKEHELSIKERGRTTSSAIVEASVMPEINETEMQSDWAQCPGNVQLYVPVLIPGCCDVMTDLPSEDKPRGLNEMPSYRGALSCTDFPLEFQSAIAASSFTHKAPEGSYAQVQAQDVLDDTSSIAKERNNACLSSCTEITDNMSAISAEVNNSSMMEFPEYCTEQLEGVQNQTMVQYCWILPYFECESACMEWEGDSDESLKEAEFYEWLEANLPSSGSKHRRPRSYADVPRCVDWHCDSKDSEDIDEPTTFMIHNVPNEYSRSMLINHLDDVGLCGKVDLVYLPIDNETSQNPGYAFINFVDAAAAAEGVGLLTSHEMPRMRRGVPRPHSQQVKLSPAHLQGFQKNVDHYRRKTSKPLVRIDGLWTTLI